MSEKKIGDACPTCPNGTLVRFEYRPGSKGDDKVCFNGIPKSDHRCVAECTLIGLICRSCNMAIGVGESEHRPEGNPWIKAPATEGNSYGWIRAEEVGD